MGVNLERGRETLAQCAEKLGRHPAVAVTFADFPFAGGAHEALPGAAGFPDLDVTGDGVLTSDDDPYAPYHPGDDAVDWMGMSLYHWGSTNP